MKTRLLLLIGCLALRSICGWSQISKPISAVSIPISSDAGGASSYAPVLSADGRFIVFTSTANNLVTNDNNLPWLDVFVRDLSDNSTKLVSINNAGSGGGNGNSYNPTISSNGQFIAFESAASNLTGNDANGVSDIFVRDMVSQTTFLASVNPNGTAVATAARDSVMSSNDRYIAFENSTNVLVRDRQASITLNASIGAQGFGFSSTPSVSADGQRVAFASSATFGSAKPKSTGEIYVRDFASSNTIWAGTNIYNLASALRSFNPDISADGRFVAFKTILTTNNINRTNLYQHDLQSGVTTLVASNVMEEGFPEMTPAGRYVAYESGTNIFRWDNATGSNVLVGVDSTGTTPANGICYRPIISADGNRIAFLSDASDLTTNGGNGQPQLYLRDVNAGTTYLVSADINGQPTSSLSGVVPTMSQDGSRVAFWSSDGKIVAEDNNRDADVFLRDIDGGNTSLVSVHVAEKASQTSPGYFRLSGNSVSADGRFVVLSALGSSLVEGEVNLLPHIITHDLATGINLPVDSLENTNGIPVPAVNNPFPTNLMSRLPVLSANGRYIAYVAKFTSDNPAIDQVYVRDLNSQTNLLVSKIWNGPDAGSSNSSVPSISGDGQLVAYQSDSSNLVPIDANGKTDVFVRDVRSASNILISVNLAGIASGNSFSLNPVISKDGHWTVFQSKASNLVTNSVSGAYFQLFARNLQSNTTTLVSSQLNGSGFSGDCVDPAISPGGGLVLFTSVSNVFLRDLAVKTNWPVCSSCLNPSMSADGRWVVYESLGAIKNIGLKDLQTGVTNLISVNVSGTGGGNRSSVNPIISFDGRYIVFASRATNLVANDTNGMTDIFIRDRIMNTTILASVNRQGTGSANGFSSKPTLGADGRTIVFQSFAPDLIDLDFNNNRDIFVLRLNAGDSDGDSLDDDWELAYFGNLGRDGSEDFDGDRHTDAQEFLLGTDPTDLGSVLRVMTLTALGGHTTILWSATLGKKYQMQFKTGIDDSAWTDLGEVVTANGSTALQLDDSNNFGNRFYRVLFVP